MAVCEREGTTLWHSNAAVIAPYNTVSAMRLTRPLSITTMAALIFAVAVLPAAARTYKHCDCAFCGGPQKHARMDHKDIDEISVDPGGPKPFPPKDDLHVRPDTNIHVLISAYRDPRCGQSVFNIFDRAAHPERMSVGIVQQAALQGDEFDCVAVYCALVQRARGEAGTGTPAARADACPHVERISVLRVDAKEAKGPIWARGLGEAMVQPHHQPVEILQGALSHIGG